MITIIFLCNHSIAFVINLMLFLMDHFFPERKKLIKIQLARLNTINDFSIKCINYNVLFIDKFLLTTTLKQFNICERTTQI